MEFKYISFHNLSFCSFMDFLCENEIIRIWGKSTVPKQKKHLTLIVLYVHNDNYKTKLVLI